MFSLAQQNYMSIKLIWALSWTKIRALILVHESPSFELYFRLIIITIIIII